MQRPRMLKPCDTVALVAPASPMYRGKEAAPDILERARERLHRAGFPTVVGAHALDIRGYLAGRDEDRARDLTAAFADPASTASCA